MGNEKNSVENSINFYDFIKEEYKKCFLDPIYFIKKYVKIQHPIKGTIPFSLYPFQEDVLKNFIKYDRNIVLKSRQMGISTLISAYSLWLMIFFRDKNILVISIKQEAAKEVITKVRFANDFLPSWLKVKPLENNKLSLRLSNGSQISATSTATDTGRSKALSLLVIDEAAMIPRAEEIWVSSQYTLSTGGKCIILSTPNGVGNFFHSMWKKAEEGSNNFNAIKLPWYLHPERDENWRKEQDKISKDPLKTAQELDCEFITSGNTVIPLSLIEWFKQNVSKEPIEKRGMDQAYWIWKYPDYSPDKFFIVSADVSRGDGGDYSAFHVIEATSMEQYAEYKGKISTKDFGNLLVAVASEYNNALLVVEREGPGGWAVIQQIIDRKYENLFYGSSDVQNVDIERNMTLNPYQDEKKLLPGFPMTLKIRPNIISNLVQYFTDKSITIYSKRTYNELETFIWENQKPQAARGYNDDLIMSLGIGLWVRDTALRIKKEMQEKTRLCLNNIVVVKNEAAIKNLYKQKYLQSVRMPVPGNLNKNIDLKWLM